MADDIKPGDPAEGQAVVSVTEVVPHEADASSAPTNTQDLPINRPPVSTNQADVPIAQSLIAGAGEGNQGQGSEDEPNPEYQTPAPAEPEPEAKRGPGRPKKETEGEG